jgi:hypothetical protein
LLDRSPELIAILDKYHHYYSTNPDYRYFLVLTQSCDLVRRDGKPPKAKYITIAAVRPVEEALRREALEHQEWWQRPLNVLGEKAYNAVALFAASLLDNNQPNYFYLHEDVGAGLAASYCAFLSLSVAIRAEHYDACLNAKILQLCEPFQAKLGWLIGNLYSRVGTQEWDEHHGKGAATREAARLLNGTFRHLSDAKIKQAVEKLNAARDLSTYSPQEILDRIKSEVIIPKNRKLSEHLDRQLMNFKLPTRIESLIIAALRHDAALFREITALLSEVDVENSGFMAAVVERTTYEAIASICRGDTENWRRLRLRLVQEIVQDETVKSLLA